MTAPENVDCVPIRHPRRAPSDTCGPMDLPAGTNLVIRMIDGVDSENARAGQTFNASIDEPVMVNGQTVIPRGADVVVKLVDAKESGKLTGRAELTLDLLSVRVDGRMVDVNTQTVRGRAVRAARRRRKWRAEPQRWARSSAPSRAAARARRSEPRPAARRAPARRSSPRASACAFPPRRA